MDTNGKETDKVIQTAHLCISSSCLTTMQNWIKLIQMEELPPFLIIMSVWLKETVFLTDMINKEHM